MRNLSFLFLLPLIIGCSVNQTEESVFGASYTISLSERTPFLEENILNISLYYSGCSNDHSFLLKKRASTSRTEVWLFKETPDQPCDGIVSEVRNFEVPQEILKQKSIIFLTPIGESVVLK
ncbi:MAG: hypothetical protein RIB15_00015 [Gracilimonas sp.]